MHWGSYSKYYEKIAKEEKKKGGLEKWGSG